METRDRHILLLIGVYAFNVVLCGIACYVCIYRNAKPLASILWETRKTFPEIELMIFSIMCAIKQEIDKPLSHTVADGTWKRFKEALNCLK